MESLPHPRVLLLHSEDACNPDLHAALGSLSVQTLQWRCDGELVDIDGDQSRQLVDQLLSPELHDVAVVDVADSDETACKQRIADLIDRIDIPLVVIGERDNLWDLILLTGADDFRSSRDLSPGSLMDVVRGTMIRHRHRRNDKQNARQLKRLIEENSDGLLVVDGEGVVQFGNQAAADLFGQTLDELIGTSLGAPSAEGETLEIDIVRTCSHGLETAAIEVHVTGIQWNERPAYLESLRDVTDYRRQMTDARDAIRLRDHFLATLSHELRNPLAALTNAAALLGMDQLDESARLLCVEVIKTQTRSMTRLLDDLLDVSRVWQGKISLEDQEVDFDQLVTEVVRSLETRFAQKCHQFELHHHNSGVQLIADPERLRQVLLNLLVNAVKYTPRGGHIRLDVEHSDKELILRVSDNGDGIEPTMLDEIFKPFIQVESSRASSEGGMGIGLSLVRKLVELHGGTVSASSDGPNCGSQFVVRLPIRIAANEKKVRHGGAENAPSAPLKVVLVEDQNNVRQMTRMLLEQLGHTVIEAADGEEGVRRIIEEEPDIALVDIGLPQLDGYAVAQRVRQHFGRDGVRLVALSGYGQEKDRLRSRQSGFDHHLAKPASIEEITNVLQDLTSER